jgi:preprotein translocase subunit YajC
VFITAAYADGPASGFDPMSMLPIVGLVAVFYFFILRPQSQKAKAHKQMLAAIRRGDRIVTSGGLIGVVTKVISDSELQVEISEGVKVRLMRPMVMSLLAKTEPVRNDSNEEDDNSVKPATLKISTQRKEKKKS